mgnify:FL=1
MKFNDIFIFIYLMTLDIPDIVVYLETVCGTIHSIVFIALILNAESRE